MHELVTRINEPKLCYVFARNAEKRGHPELALQAYRRAVDLRAATHVPEVDNEAELAALRSIYAYEEALSYSKGKRTRATGTWQMVNKHGVFLALAKRMNGRGGEEIKPVLQELGMADYSFEAVRTEFPDAFEEQQAA
ncbi:MAG: hypothetical protein V7746_16730 [Halioglobus sp.]